MRVTGATEIVRSRSRVLQRAELLVAAIGFFALLGPLHAQNAAQRKALASLAAKHPDSVSASSVEATNVGLSRPGGLAFDAAGNLYIANTGDNIVYQVDLNGVITTIAGTGEEGFAGDGGPATSAELDRPVGLAVDASGNLYIADSHNNRIREVAAGVITTVAGNGSEDFSGDGGTATVATLNHPMAVAVDSKGNIYIADTGNHRIRMITGTTISTVAGNGEQTYSGDGGPATAAGLDSPTGIAVDTSFNFYISDTLNQRVRMVTASSGIITTIAGTGEKSFTADGNALSGALARPRGLALDTNGTLYVADSDNNRIRSISNGTMATIAGDGSEGFSGDTGSSTNASLDTPRAVATPPAGGSVAFADTDNNRVRTSSGGTVNTTGGQGSQGPEQLSIGGATGGGYGAGSLTVTFAHGGQTGTGTITFYDGLGSSPSVLGSAALVSNTATLDTSRLSAGTHYLIASYAGDANNAAVTSGAYVYVITPAPVTAVANGVKMLYGQSVPALTGSLNGVLAQDSGKVAATFTTTASATSTPGAYAIGVTLTGSSAGNYDVTLGSGSGSVVVAQAPSTTTLALNTATPIYGTPLTLTATVASTTSGIPSGTVNFYSGATLLNTVPATLSSGVATLNVSSLPVGSVALTAVYSGDTNFLTSTSASMPGTVLSPEFTVGASPASQSVLPSQAVSYSITVTPTNSTFVYPVTLSVSGLPSGVTASLNPSSIATGSAATTSTLTLTASASAELHHLPNPWSRVGRSAALAFILLPLAFGRRARTTARRLSRTSQALVLLVGLAILGSVTGCGAGGFYSHAKNAYTVTITAVSGPNTHSTSVTLTVQ